MEPARNREYVSALILLLKMAGPNIKAFASENFLQFFAVFCSKTFMPEKPRQAPAELVHLKKGSTGETTMSDLRELNGHPLRVLRAQHNLTLEELAQETGVAAATISRAENGYLVSAAVRKLLCKYFNKTSQELGLLGRGKDLPPDPIPPQPISTPPEQPLTITPHPPDKKEVPTIIIARTHPLDILNEQSDLPPEQQLGAWLALEAGQIGQLFDADWTVEAILNSLEVLLRGVQGMTMITRRALLQAGTAALVSGFPVLGNKHISEEERMQLVGALGKSVGDGWKLFHTGGNIQVLVVGKAQLHLIEQNHSFLATPIRSMFYASIYNLIGMAQHFQEHHEEALQAHNNAYIAALQAGDFLHATQSLICQANGYQALGQHSDAIQTIEEALRVIRDKKDETYIRSKAHLLGCWADSAMTLGEDVITQQKLDESALYLDYITPNEEFDHASWLQLSGKYAFMRNKYVKAIQYFEEALTILPPHWAIRCASNLVPLAVAYARIKEPNASLDVAKKLVNVVDTVNAQMINKQFTQYIQKDLLNVFPDNIQVHNFVKDTLHQLPQLYAQCKISHI